MLAGEEAALYDKKTSSGLDVSDFALEDAWSRVQSSGDAMHGEHAEVVDWLLATYDPASTVGGRGPQRVVFQCKGSGGFLSLVKHLDAGLVQFGAFAIRASKVSRA